MTKFQKIQKVSSVIPFYSSFFVFIVTMIEFKRYKASIKLWIHFTMISSLTVALVFLLNNVVMTGQHLVLNYIASGLMLAIMNIICVDLQVKCISETKTENQKRLFSSSFIWWLSIGLAILLAIGMVLTKFLTPSVDISDINGESDANLAVIILDDVLSVTNYFSAFEASSFHAGEKTNVDAELINYDYDEYRFSCKKMSGIKTLMATNISSNSLIFEISSKLESGNMEIFIIIDGKYYDSVAPNQTESIILDNISGKTIVIKLAAESAKVQVSVRRQ